MRHLSHNCKTLFSFNGSHFADGCHLSRDAWKGKAYDRLRRVSFSSDLVRLVHARAQAVNGEAARLEVPGYTSGAYSHARGHFRVSSVTFDELRKKKETVRKLDRWGRARISLFNIMQVLWLTQKYSYFCSLPTYCSIQFSAWKLWWLGVASLTFVPLIFFNYSNKSMQKLGEQLHDYTSYTSIIN